MCGTSKNAQKAAHPHAQIKKMWRFSTYAACSILVTSICKHAETMFYGSCYACMYTASFPWLKITNVSDFQSLVRAAWHLRTFQKQVSILLSRDDTANCFWWKLLGPLLNNLHQHLPFCTMSVVKAVISQRRNAHTWTVMWLKYI